MWLILFKEEDETLLFIVDDFLPEIIPSLVAFAWYWAVDSTGVILLTHFESNYHEEGIAGECFEE